VIINSRLTGNDADLVTISNSRYATPLMAVYIKRSSV